ncbi:alpha/beta hydrolase [Dokdonia sinensis]|uniref:Alpha/beta hydrolase n=1 Tax=Dokdonia sinensis TaxID=2479847 RepID=A0A3M0G865_9FLAO|nr:alpha/beta hydrolase [Dokdonia sinensis]RMB58602.1 alpha/beta hydrolase [Dokdonia sinensis]
MIIQHKGASIFYTDQGAGNAIVLLHGFLENSTMWEPVINELKDNHRVICIDLLGHGKTECIGYVHTMEDMAEAVHTVIGILQLNDVTLIGHSMGGYVGCAFAKAYPEKIIKLCLLNSTPNPDDNERVTLRRRANKMAQTQYAQLVRMSFTNLFDHEAQRANRSIIDVALKEALKTPLQGYLAANEGMAIRPDYGNFWINTPIITAMILGTTDWIIDAAAHKEAYERGTNYFKIIEGGHMTHISNTAETMYALAKFISY